MAVLFFSRCDWISELCFVWLCKGNLVTDKELNSSQSLFVEGPSSFSMSLWASFQMDMWNKSHWFTHHCIWRVRLMLHPKLNTEMDNNRVQWVQSARGVGSHKCAAFPAVTGTADLHMPIFCEINSLIRVTQGQRLLLLKTCLCPWFHLFYT